MREQKMSVAEIVFRANKSYYDTCEALKGKVDPKLVDFDAYAYFNLESVPEGIDFGSKSKKYESPKLRLKEFNKYLFFLRPDNLDACEAKYSEAEGMYAVCKFLNSLGFKCNVEWSYR